MIHVFANFIFISLICFLWLTAKVGLKQCGGFRFGLSVVVRFCVCKRSHKQGPIPCLKAKKQHGQGPGVKT